MSKPTILVYGNCQASVLAQVFSRLPGIGEVCEVRYIPSFAHPISGKPPVPKVWLERCLLFLEQRGVWDEFEHKSDLPGSAALLRYPTVSLRSLWPLQASDPRNRAIVDFPFGQYPYGDRLVLELLEAGYSGEALLCEYMARDLPGMVDLDRLFELELERQRQVDLHCDIRLADFIRTHFRSTRLFWTHNHPSAALHKYTLRSLLAQLGALGGGLDDVAVAAWLDEYFQDREPTGEVSVALHPQVISHFKLHWADEQTRYWHFRGEPVAYREYMLDYIRFAPQQGPIRSTVPTLDTASASVSPAPGGQSSWGRADRPTERHDFRVFDAGQWLMPGQPPERLRRVTVEVTTWCNLECPGCLRTQGFAAGSWHNRHMSVETFAQVVDICRPRTCW